MLGSIPLVIDTSNDILPAVIYTNWLKQLIKQFI